MQDQKFVRYLSQIPLYSVNTMTPLGIKLTSIASLQGGEKRKRKDMEEKERKIKNTHSCTETPEFYSERL